MLLLILFLICVDRSSICCLKFLTSSSSSSSSSSAPIGEHSRLHKLTPLWTILRTHPRCVETKVMGPKVELYCTEPYLPWSTCPASPIRWTTIDGCSKNAHDVRTDQTKSSLCDNWGDWGLTCYFFVGDHSFIQDCLMKMRQTHIR